MSIKIQWEEFDGKIRTKEAEEVKDLGKGHYLVTWVGGGTCHFAPADNLKVI